MWREGTELRDKDGFYLWPPIADGPEFPLDAERYPSYSRIQRTVYGDPDIAHAAWVSQEAQRLFALHNAGLPAHRANLEAGEFGLERIIEEVSPAELFNDPNYLRKFGWSMSTRAAHRGTVTHKLLRYWHTEGPMHPVDVPYWVDQTIGAGDGIAPYLCDVDETTGYCLSLAHWLHETGFSFAATEIPGFRDGDKRYACTLDAIGGFPDDEHVYVLDVKTSAASNRFHALQLAAQSSCDWYGVPGTSEQLEHGQVFVKPPVLASLLVQPEKTTFRICSADVQSWDKTLDLYYGLFAEAMPFKTESLRTMKTPRLAEVAR